MTKGQCAQVVANRTHALKNIAAAYPMNLHPEDVESSAYLCYPLRKLDRQERRWLSRRDAGDESRAKRTKSRPIWVRGVRFGNDRPTLESRDWIEARYIRTAAAMAYRQAGINDPANENDLFEVDDSYPYKELQPVALGASPQAVASGKAVENAETSASGKMPVNVSGGSLGIGHTLEASGLTASPRSSCQLRGKAGPGSTESESRVGTIFAPHADDERRGGHLRSGG